MKRIQKSLLLEALKTIPPSSIESERTFSVMGFYNTKLRCSLGNQSINALVFLKHIFQKEEQEEKDRIARLARIEKNLAKNKHICT